MASVYFFISLLHLLPLWGWFMLFFQCDCKVYVQLWEWTQPSQVSKLNCLLPSLPQHATTFAANILFVTTVLSSPLTAASSPVVHALVFLLFLPCCGNFVLLAVAAVPSGHTHTNISPKYHCKNTPQTAPPLPHPPPFPLWCEVTAGEPFDLKAQCTFVYAMEGASALLSACDRRGPGCHDSGC